MNNLRNKVKLLETPQDYYHGLCQNSPPSPREIVLFTRRKAEEMNLYSKPYFHHRYVLICSMEGQGRLIVDKQIISLEKNQMLLIFPFQNHYFQLEDSEEILWLFIGFEMDDTPLLQPLKYKVCPFTLDTPLILEEIIDLNTEPDASPIQQALCSQALGTLLYHIADQSQDSVTGKVAEGRDARFIQDVHNYAYGRIKEPLSVAKMAEDLGYSESGLRKRFQASLGFSPALFLRQIKMSRGAALLADSSRSVGEIARLCGFDSQYSFSRSFKNSLGKSPLEYRRRYMN